MAPKSVVHGWIDEAARFAPTPSRASLRRTDRAALRDRVDRAGSRRHQLRNAAARHRTPRSAALRLRDPRRSADDQERRVADRARRERSARRAPARAHRDTRSRTTSATWGRCFEFLNPGHARPRAWLRGADRGPPGRGDARARSRARCGRSCCGARRRRCSPNCRRRPSRRSSATSTAGSAGTTTSSATTTSRRSSGHIERDGLARAKIHVLEALLRLRQAACHPALLDPRRAADRVPSSTSCFEQLDEVLDEGHKVLVFSQFTRLLARVRERLDERDVRVRLPRRPDARPQAGGSRASRTTRNAGSS